jgi:lactate dehydrogenase-like 2-hydroxyacid dehydrogenase
LIGIPCIDLYQTDIAGAAFDVFWQEPTDPDDRLLKLDNFVYHPILLDGPLNLY